MKKVKNVKERKDVKSLPALSLVLDAVSSVVVVSGFRVKLNGVIGPDDRVVFGK